jgi:hypothetical protein
MFLYKGANYPNAKISYKYKNIEVAEGEVAKDSAESWKSIVKGATYQVKGSVKLGDYKGIKQTFLQRLTISKDLGLLEYSDMQELNNKIESAQAL